MSVSSSLSRPEKPSLSVILPTIDGLWRIDRTITHLEAQTARSELEVLVVAPSVELLGLDRDLSEAFFDFRILDVGEIQSLSEVKAVAVADARSDLVVFAEDHSWPDPDWAAAIIEAHASGYAAVGPKVRNANPGSILSWANYLACFGRWSDKSQAGEVLQTPWHNSSYRRKDLVACGSDLPRLLAVEGVLQDKLRERGHRLFLLPEVTTDHVNISRFGSWLRQSFWGGKLYGGARSVGESWGALRRIIYIAGSPLIPLLRFKRMLPELRRFQEQTHLLPRVIPALALSFAIHAIGEASGYAFGIGSAGDRYIEFEARRFEAISHQDLVDLGLEQVVEDNV